MKFRFLRPREYPHRDKHDVDALLMMASEALYSAILKRLKEQGYNDPKTVPYEHQEAVVNDAIATVVFGLSLSNYANTKPEEYERHFDDLVTVEITCPTWHIPFEFQIVEGGREPFDCPQA